MSPGARDGGVPSSVSRFSFQTRIVNDSNRYVRAGGPASARISARGMRSDTLSAVPVTTKFAYPVRGSYQDADDWYSRATVPPSAGGRQEAVSIRTAAPLSRGVMLSSV